MLQIYGSAVSSPTNKVRYTANYLNIPNEFHSINLAAGEHRSPEFLQMNAYGRIPVIDDDGFYLAESNAIIRYLAAKEKSDIYSEDLRTRAKIDQWIDFASMHVMLSLSRIMFNTYFYRFAKVEKDERSLEDGQRFINQYLPIVNTQLEQNTFIVGDFFSLADIAMIASLDVVEMANVELQTYRSIVKWRNDLMQMDFYTKCHVSFQDAFKKVLERMM